MKTLMMLACLLMTTLVLAAPALATVGPDPAATQQQSTVSGGEATPQEQPDTPQRGTAQEVRDYEQRQAESPEVQEFAGGFHGAVVVLLLVILIVLIVD